jgi:FixJ family two-component response regulator
MRRKQSVAEAPLISIVDDDQSVRDALGNLLRSVGFRVEVFASAENLLDSDHLSDTDCLILDARMPGMSGLELQRQLAESRCRVPIIFITAYSDGDAQARALGAGAMAFLHKPFAEGALLRAIDGALRRF